MKPIGTMVMLPKFGPDLQTPGEMVGLLMSSELHAHRKFYPHFVAALGSGRMCKIKKQKSTTPLAEFISVDYEAHFRLELWACLGRQGSSPSTLSLAFLRSFFYSLLVFVANVFLSFLVFCFQGSGTIAQMMCKPFVRGTS